MSSISAGLSAFRESFFTSNPLDEAPFGDFDARRMRYQIYWSFYEGSVYRKIHSWANLYKNEYGLYRYTRGIYNPAYRIGEFWRAHLWGGALDPNAGDGKTVPSSIPIITPTDNQPLREAIAQIWRWSNWQIKKDIPPLWGAVMGDCAIKVIDDTERQKVYLQVVHPGTIKAIEVDDYGNVKGYEIEQVLPEKVENGKSSGKVTFLEVATRDGDKVRYKTYRNGKLFPWNGDEAEWDEPYGFIPMVILQHNNVGVDFGWSEFHANHAKFREIDDQASKLSDQIRKAINPGWLFSGVGAPKGEKSTATGAEPTANAPEPGREEIPALYGPAGAAAHPLVFPLDIASTSQWIDNLLKVIEQDYPELSADMHNVQGEISGRALRINQAPAADKVLQRRASYDDALVRAQQMAVAIAGFRGLPAAAGFDLSSYDAGALDHSIGSRPVFISDPLDRLEIEEALWSVAAKASESGVPLDVYLKRQGWSDEEVKTVVESETYQAKLDALKAATVLQDTMNGGDEGHEEPDEQKLQSAKKRG